MTTTADLIARARIQVETLGIYGVVSGSSYLLTALSDALEVQSVPGADSFAGVEEVPASPPEVEGPLCIACGGRGWHQGWKSGTRERCIICHGAGTRCESCGGESK